MEDVKEIAEGMSERLQVIAFQAVDI